MTEGRRRGAPPGNRNALKHGQRVGDMPLRRAMTHASRSLTWGDYQALLAGLRQPGEHAVDGGVLRRASRHLREEDLDAIREALSGATDNQLITGQNPPQTIRLVDINSRRDLARTRKTSSSASASQTIHADEDDLVRRLEGYKYDGARHLTRTHREHREAIGAALDRLDEMPDAEYDRLVRPSGWLWETVHRSIFVEAENGELRCPVGRCKWWEKRDEDAETGS